MTAITTQTPAMLFQVSILPKAALVSVVLLQKLRISHRMFQNPRYVMHIIARIKAWVKKSVMTERFSPTGLPSILGYLSALQCTEFFVQPVVAPSLLTLSKDQKSASVEDGFGNWKKLYKNFLSMRKAICIEKL